MITQNYILNFINNISAVSSDSNKLDKNDKAGLNSTPDFKEFLDKTSSKVSEISKTTDIAKNQKSSVNVQGSKDNQDEKTEQDVKFKSYKEAVNKDISKSSSKVSDGSKVEADDSLKTTDDVKKDNTKVKENEAVACFAQVLGIKPEELLQVLDKLNIKTSDLLDTSKTSQITEKISSLLGLDEQQKQALSEMLKTVNIKVNEDTKLAADDSLVKEMPVIKKMDDSSSKQNTDDVKLPELEERKLVESNDASLSKDTDKQVLSTQDLKVVMDNMKAKVDAFAQKIQQSPQKAINDLNLEFDKVIDQNNNLKANNVEQQPKEPEAKTKGDTKVNDENESQLKNQVVSEKNDLKQNTGSDKQSKDAKDESYKDSGSKASVRAQDFVGEKSTQEDVKPVQLDNIVQVQPQKTEFHENIQKVVGEVHVSKNEIINQVIEKAKVVLNGDKSEMVMDLKPDNLGKLALKVVTERGIVVAKFVAENQQVKQVLESNMQLLKDSLEKQGLSVQGFSVSVQQDSSRGFNNFNEENENGRKEKFKSGITTGNMINVSDLSQLKQSANPYEWAGSKFNLTA